MEADPRVDLLGRSGNVAIISVSDRAFPFVALPGDSLKGFLEDILEAEEEIHSSRISDAEFSLRDLRENLQSMLAFYAQVCSERNIGLPYHDE